MFREETAVDFQCASIEKHDASNVRPMYVFWAVAKANMEGGLCQGHQGTDYARAIMQAVYARAIMAAVYARAIIDD